MLPPIFRHPNELSILFVGFSSGARTVLAAALKELGFSNLKYAPDFTSALKTIKDEKINWVIATVQDDNRTPVTSFLEGIDVEPNGADIRTSLFLNVEDAPTLVAAFERGVLSCHRSNGSHDEFLQEMKELLSLIATHSGDDTLIAAHYFTAELMTLKRYDQIVRIYQTLTRLYPDNHGLALPYAQALFANGDQDTAMAVLLYAKLMNPVLLPQVKALLQKMGNEDQMEHGEAYLGRHYKLKRCLIIDPSEQDGRTLLAGAQQVGFNEVVQVKDAVAATAWLKSNASPDLIICEWALPKMPGPIFLYRLQAKHNIRVPLIICNEKIGERDAIIINELGVSTLLAKPLNASLLPREILRAVTQHANPTDLRTIKRRLYLAAKAAFSDEIHYYCDLLLKHPDISEGDRLLTQAILSYERKDFDETKQSAIAALNQGADMYESMEVLGKSLMKLRQFDLAIRCLENVRFLSPTNVDHLCNLAECYLEQDDEKSFDTLLNAAKEIDEDAPKVVETELKGELKKKNAAKTRYLMQKLKSYQEILTFMNNRAVSLIHTGNTDEAFELYQKTIAALPPGRGDLSAVIHYNLSLGYARSGRLDEASKVLPKALHSKDPALAAKAGRLAKNITKALTSGKQLTFAAKEKSVESERDKKNMLASLVDTSKPPATQAQGTRGRGLHAILQAGESTLQAAPPAMAKEEDDLQQMIAIDDENIIIG